VRPPWLGADDIRLTLPFDDGAFDHIVVDRAILEAVAPAKVFAEVGRVLREGGAIDIAITDRPDAEAPPSVGPLIADAARLLRVRTIVAEGGRIILKATNGQRRDGRHADSLAAIARAFIRLAADTRQMAVQHTRRVEELQGRYDLAVTELAQARERLDESAKGLAEFRTTIDEAEHELTVVRSNAAATAQTAHKEADRLRADLQSARDQLQYERWRAKVAVTRKASRIGDQVRRLRRPWRLPGVLYRVVRIAAGPTITPPRPDRGSTGVASTAGSPRARPSIRAMDVPDVAPKRPDLRVATILDEFSELAFRYEFQLAPVPRPGWREAFERARPDLLFVESAWNGNGGAWKYAVAGQSAPKPDVVELVQYCREHQIPTVFWNKEDPLEYEQFIRTARHFDWVFTVDEKCVERYRTELGHDRVGVLPFGVQPRIHNPIDAFRPRKEAVAFAGTYYSGKYPERMRQIDYLLKPVGDLGLHIFSRWEDNPRYSFPEELKSYVVGSLDYAQILTAYRQYKVFLNVNSVTDSKTMFSRRVLELLACGTPVVSGPSPGMEAMLGAGVVAESTDADTSRNHVRALLNSEELRDVMAVKGIRAVMSGNTYSDRVTHLLASLGQPTAPARRSISIIAPTNRMGGYKQILENVGRQVHGDIELIIGLHGIDEKADHIRGAARDLGIDNLEFVTGPADWSLGRVLNAMCAAAGGEFIAKMDDDDLYGPNYLSDQLFAFDYTDADIVGKWSRLIYLEEVPCLGIMFPGHEHRYTELVGGGTILAKREVLDNVRFADRSTGEDTQFLRDCAAKGFRTYSTDRFNHVYMRYGDSSRHTYRPHVLHHLANTRIVSFGSSVTQAFV